MGGVVREETKDGVYAITFNKPEKKNALNKELMGALEQALNNAKKSGRPIVVLRGAGKCFSAGGDLGEFRQLAHEGKSLSDGVEILNRCIMLIRTIDAIVVAVLEGPVVGAAIGISLACDLSVAARNTVMNMAYRRIGLTPDGGGSLMLPRIIGTKRCNELYFLARNVDMKEAKDLGLVNFVWEEEELEVRLGSLLADLKALPTETIGRFKSLANDAVFEGLSGHLDRERLHLSELAESPDFRERLEGFFAKK
jgi:2-(1,2-epoxy-1,2-dihydrophenyl)acetyl-CoA isomerase